MKRKKEEILRIVETSTQYAKDHGLTVEFLAEDATRSDTEFITEVFEVAVSAGADKLCPCDTVGVLTPEKTFKLFRRLSHAFPDIPLGVHCHNDFGLAVANSITALRSGASEVHVTMNGLGERAGNASLEEIVVALKVLYGLELPIKTERLYETSRLVAQLTDFYLQPNKAIVGENAFVHESGMHTHGVLVHPLTYEPIAPELVGRTRRLVSGKHAGSHGIKASLNEIGIHPNEEQLKEIFLRIKTLGDKGKRVTDPDLLAIAEAVMELSRIRPIKLEELTVVTGDKVTPTASVRLSLNGSAVTEAATGVGPVDAAMAAVRKAVSAVEPIQLENYSVKAITGGTNAITEVAVLLRKGQRTATAIGANEDIVTASVEAMLSGMNVLMINYNQKKKSEGK
jgi:D-citramalate synthase